MNELVCSNVLVIFSTKFVSRLEQCLMQRRASYLQPLVALLPGTFGVGVLVGVGLKLCSIVQMTIRYLLQRKKI